MVRKALLSLFIFGALAAGMPALAQEAAGDAIGRYQGVSQSNTGNLWIVDTATGKARVCLPPSRDPDLPMECTEWGPEPSAVWGARRNSGDSQPRRLTFEEARSMAREDSSVEAPAVQEAE